jgi:tetratricopeptide (TPR) repeat protein
VAHESGGYRFRHHKLGEVAYDRIDSARRPALHRVTADVLERKLPAPEAAAGWAKRAAVAHHREAAGETAAALAMLERAGEEAIRWGAYRDGERLVTRAIALGEKVHGATSGDEQAVRAASRYRLRADARFALGDIRSSSEDGERALALLGRRLPAGAAAWTAFLSVHVPRALAGLWMSPERLAAPARQQAEVSQASRTAARLTVNYYFTEQSVLGIAASLLAVNEAVRATEPLPVARAFASLASVAGILGMPRVSGRLMKRAKEVARSSGDDCGLAVALYSDAALEIGAGELAAAFALGRDALEVSTRARDLQEIGMSETVLAHAAHYGGLYDEALEHLERLRSAAVECSNRQHQAWSEYSAARSLIPLGRLSEAEAHLERAADLLRAVNDHASNTICMGLKARLALARNDLASALTLAAETARLNVQTPPLVFSTRDAYEAVCEVEIAALARGGAAAGGGDFERRSARALKAYRAYTRRFALGRPSYLLLSGDFAAATGRERHAKRDWSRAHALGPDRDPGAHAAAAARLSGGATRASVRTL